MTISFRHTSIALALLLISGTGCKESGETAPEGDTQTLPPGMIRVSTQQFESNGMSIGTPEMRQFPSTLEVSGIIDVPPENRAVVSAVSGGFVKTITLLVGDKVKKGQLIVALESPEFLKIQQQYLEAREQLPFLEAEYRRQKTMLEENITSEKLYLQAESQYRTTMAQQNSLGRQLELLNISTERVAAGELTSLSPVYAPISGSLTQVNVRKGAYVSPATEIAEIVDNTHLHLELNVFERDISRLQIGQLIKFRLPEHSDSVYTARVHLIGRSIGEDRTVRVHAHLEDEEDHGFIVGMYVRAAIEVDGQASGEQRISLPESAVVTYQGKAYALLLEESDEKGYVFRQVPIEAGTPRDGFVPVSGASLETGSRVLVAGAFNLVQPE